MGLLGKLLGGAPKHPPLDPQSSAARMLERWRPSLEPFVKQVKDRMELIPTEPALYAFIGKPPGAFGVAWIKDGKVHNLKSLMQERGLSAQRVQVLSDDLRESYKRHQGDARFTAEVAGSEVTVTPSEVFARDVEKIIHELEG